MRNNIPLLVGIALPIIIIVAVAAFIFLPSISIKPAHDFLYTNERDQYNYNVIFKNDYDVVDKKLVLKPRTLPTIEPTYPRVIEDAPRLYRYEVKTNTAHEIPFKDAALLSLVPGPSSPDGYTVEYRYGHDGIFELFGSNNSNRGYFMTKGGAGKRLKLNDTNYYSDEIKLVGWIQ